MISQSSENDRALEKTADAPEVTSVLTDRLWEGSKMYQQQMENKFGCRYDKLDSKNQTTSAVWANNKYYGHRTLPSKMVGGVKMLGLYHI